MRLEIDAVKEAASQRAAVETRGLTKRYRSVAALDGCTITVPRGRISALIGHNGAGKTTLLRILCGLARPSAGSVSVLGHAPGQGDTGFLAEVGFLAQDIPLYRARVGERPVTVVGQHCESGDILARDALLPSDLTAGDLVCSLVTGAYGYSMASTYNRLGRPAVVFAANGHATTVLRRETPTT